MIRTRPVKVQDPGLEREKRSKNFQDISISTQQQTSVEEQEVKDAGEAKRQTLLSLEKAPKRRLVKKIKSAQSLVEDLKTQVIGRSLYLLLDILFM